jgi:hypothetical protein
MHERLIGRLFRPEDRPLAQAIANQCLRGMNEDRQVAVIHELAQPTDLTI